MKLYFVVPAPIVVGGCAPYFNLLERDIAAPFFSEDEAGEYARELARANSGYSYWVVSGAPIYSCHCEPLPVVQSVVNIEGYSTEAG